MHRRHYLQVKCDALSTTVIKKKLNIILRRNVKSQPIKTTNIFRIGGKMIHKTLCAFFLYI